MFGFCCRGWPRFLNVLNKNRDVVSVLGGRILCHREYILLKTEEYRGISRSLKRPRKPGRETESYIINPLRTTLLLFIAALFTHNKNMAFWPIETYKFTTLLEVNHAIIAKVGGVK